MLIHDAPTSCAEARDRDEPDGQDKQGSGLDLRPEIVSLPDRRMAVVHTVGDPERLLPVVLPPLYSSVYTLKCERRRAGSDFRLEHVRVRWLDVDAERVSRELCHIIWGLPIPEDTTSLPQRFRRARVEIETWDYGMVAQLIYRGPSLSTGRAHQQQAIVCLKDYIKSHGYEISGSMEEEYLVGPEPKLQRTRLRFPIRRQVNAALVPVRERSLVLYRPRHDR